MNQMALLRRKWAILYSLNKNDQDSYNFNSMSTVAHLLNIHLHKYTSCIYNNFYYICNRVGLTNPCLRLWFTFILKYFHWSFGRLKLINYSFKGIFRLKLYQYLPTPNSSYSHRYSFTLKYAPWWYCSLLIKIKMPKLSHESNYFIFRLYLK